MGKPVSLDQCDDAFPHLELGHARGDEPSFEGMISRLFERVFEPYLVPTEDVVHVGWVEPLKGLLLGYPEGAIGGI